MLTYFLNNWFFDSVDKTAPQTDLSIERKATLQNEFADTTNLITKSDPYFVSKKFPLSCDYNYQNLQCLSNKGLLQFFLKMFLSNYRESQSYKFLVFLSVWPKYCLIFKSMFFFIKFRWTFTAIPFLYKIIQKHFEKK